MSMTEKARAVIAKYGMLADRDHIFAGISGGADSVALLGLLLALQKEFSLEITAMHLNHMLRGDESERDEAHVKLLCERLEVELVSERADIRALAAGNGLTLEEAGRKARYDFFTRCGDEHHGAANTKIAVAHTLGDSVETALLNFTRGTSVRGLAGIPPIRGSIIRPLITSTRAEIEIYCKDNNLEYITDSSNFSDDFARNRLRRHVVPVLESINPSLFKTIAPNLEAIRADADYLDGLAEQAAIAIQIDNARFNRPEYLRLADPVRMRTLLYLLRKNGITADSVQLTRLDARIRAGQGAEQLSAAVFLKAGKQCFTFDSPKPDTEFFEVALQIPVCGAASEFLVFSDKKLRLMNTDYENYEESINYIGKTLKNALDYDKIDGILQCRQKLPSDCIKLCGRGCTKTLKKLFQEAKIPIAEREKLFVIADAGGVVWVEDFGVCERAAVTGDTKRVLILDVRTEG